MTLPSFLKEKNVEAKPKVEWDGKDYRGDLCCPHAIEYMRQHPTVFKWLRNRPRNSINNGCTSLRRFCDATKITPAEFITLDRKTARDLAWGYLDNIRRKTPGAALVAKNNISSFYYFHTDEKLVFNPQKHKIGYELQKVKERMSKEICWKIINKARTLRDETILTMDFESGLRKNAISHMTYGHYKNFLWFRKEGEEVFPCTLHPEKGNIALFKVVPKKHPEYTHDDKLKDKRINWYYGCLHKEATTILKRYVEIYHKDSTNDTPLFFSMHPLSKNKALGRCRLYDVLKDCAKRAGLNPRKYSFKELRRGFRGVVRNTKRITDNEFKEAIMGHKLKGSQENYFDKDPLEFAREYAKCDFSPPAPEKDKLLVAKDKEIETLRKQMLQYEEAIANAKVTTKIEIEPLGPPATRDQIQNAFKDFNEALEEQSTPQPTETEARPPTKPLSKPLIVKDQVEQPKEIEKPKATGYSSFASLKEKPSDYITCTKTKQAYKLEDLPCMVNPLLSCDNKLCQNEIMKLIT